MRTMDSLNLIFCLMCIIAGVLTVIGGVLWIAANATFISVVISIYEIIFGLWAIIVEVFMPIRLQSWVGFYLTWVGKGLYFIFIGVLLLLPYEENVARYRAFFLIAAIYLFVLAVILIAFQILACVSVHGHSTSHPIIFVEKQQTTTLHAGLAEAPSTS